MLSAANLSALFPKYTSVNQTLVLKEQTHYFKINTSDGSKTQGACILKQHGLVFPLLRYMQATKRL